jgi:hypothetical protein
MWYNKMVMDEEYFLGEMVMDCGSVLEGLRETTKDVIQARWTTILGFEKVSG